MASIARVLEQELSEIRGETMPRMDWGMINNKLLAMDLGETTNTADTGRNVAQITQTISKVQCEYCAVHNDYGELECLRCGGPLPLESFPKLFVW